MKRALPILCVLFGALTTSVLAAGPQRVPPKPDPTLHVYRETMTGGTVQVVAREVPASFVASIRERLKAQGQAYARGEYDDPAPHSARPGATLRANSNKISVAYTQIDAGGQLTFKTGDSKLVDALHQWFAEQVAVGHQKEPHGGPGDLPSQ